MSTVITQNAKDTPAFKPEAKPELKSDQKEGAGTKDLSRADQAEALIRRNVLWSLGAGFVPIPFLDVLAIMGVQVKMLRSLAGLYELKFSDGLAKKLIGTLLGSIGVVGIGGMIGGSLAKFIPAIGTTLGLLTVPVLSGAVTHATGKVFMMHFEAGGTLLTFDPQVMRAYFKQEFEKAKEVVTKLQQDQKTKSATPA